nr:FAD-dependent oxidoreductase [Desulfacinum hydrothermale]
MDRSPCTSACPGMVNAHAYVALTAIGRYKEALEVIYRTLPFPGVISRICPHPCESACRRKDVDEPIAICDLKRFIADTVDLSDLHVTTGPKRNQKVAVVGGGPAGLSAAYFLARHGFSVTIFEAEEEVGGMLRYVIPDYVLPKDVLDREVGFLKRLGVEMRCRTALGRDVTIDGLLAQGYAAVFVATGAPKGIPLQIPGEDANGVMQGVDFLRRVQQGTLDEVPTKVAVVGGDDTAFYAARSARRLGAEEVIVIYSRDLDQLPARPENYREAVEEGVRVLTRVSPVEVVEESGQARGLRCVRTTLKEADTSGRRRPVPEAGSDIFIEAPLIIAALGRTPDTAGLSEAESLPTERFATLQVDPVTFETPRPGVFAGGEVCSGPWVAIGAVAAGREAAESIRRYVDGEDLRADRESLEPLRRHFMPIPENETPRPRATMPRRDPSERITNFREVNLGLSEMQARSEAKKCLNCMGCCECLACVEACRAEAVRHDERPQEVRLEVGSVILAPGFRSVDPSRYDTYAYADHPNVITALEFERILSATGPFQGHLVRPSDHKEPRRIAWLQCVGSRDMHHCDNGYCSAVCCMYAVKEAVIAREHSPYPLETTIFFMDMRTYGKDFERYYEKAKASGVRFVRSRIHSVEPVAGSDDLRLRYVDGDGRMREEDYDLVVLSTGLESSEETVRLAERLGISLSPGRFAQTRIFAPVSTSRPGVYVCGALSGPKDIPQSVMEASAAACAATEALCDARYSRTRTVELPAPRDVTGEKPRIGVFICNCGINIGGVVRVPEVVAYAKELPGVVYAQENLFSCSQDTQEKMAEIIGREKLNRVVIAACSPRTHEPLFQETLSAAGLNPYLLEMANIRNLDAWVHGDDPDGATRKAKDMVRMAVAKALLLEPLEQTSLPVSKKALVVGGGVAGMTAALSLARHGYPVVLVEKSKQLGGQANRLHKTAAGDDVADALNELVGQVTNHPLVTVHLETEIQSVEGFVGNFHTCLACGETRHEVDHGVTIIATGAKEWKPDIYGYGAHRAVMTHLELDEHLKSNDQVVATARTIVFIQCVGSRDSTRAYCSKVCCTHTMVSALECRKRNPDADIYVLYRDIRTYGEREALYREARAQGIVFIRYSPGSPPRVTPGPERVAVTFREPILERDLALEADVVCLASAIVSHHNNALAQLFKVPMDSDGWFLEAHQKLRPVDFATEGVFVCGLAHYPKPLEESIAQAKAAASRAMTVLASRAIRVGGVVSVVDASRCSGCMGCVNVCPFGAIGFDEEMRAARINPALCKGCGACAAVCPSEAIALKGFTNQQLYAVIKTALA